MHYEKCAVLGCNDISKECCAIKYSFPSSAIRRVQWENFCPKRDWDSKICRRHFDLSQFQTTKCVKLHRNAVPTLFPPTTATASSECIPSSSSSITPDLCQSISLSPTSWDNFTYNINDPPISSREQILLQRRGIYSHLINFDISPDLTPSSSANEASAKNLFSSRIKCGSQNTVKHSSILSVLGMTQIKQLSPRNKVLYDEVMRLREKIIQLEIIAKKINNVNSIHSLNRHRLMYIIEKRLSNSSTRHLASIMKKGQCKNKGRKWTQNEKLICLSVFKKYPKVYGLLRYVISLPSEKNLMSVLSCLILSTGINSSMFQHLSSVVKGQNVLKRYCVLVFDEISIRPYFSYDSKEDKILGYVDYGSKGRSNIVAEQALVFMARSIFKNWKQPVAYYFSPNRTPCEVLKELIEEVLKQLKFAGLKVVATVCDTRTNNVNALQLMGATFDDPSFEFQGHTVRTVFDPNHLLKCFRNLFLKHDILLPVVYKEKEIEVVGCWEHLWQTYEQHSGLFYSFCDLRERNLNPEGLNKNKVHIAAQVFNEKVVSIVAMQLMFGLNNTEELGTKEVLSTICMLFGYLNGNKISDKQSIYAKSSHMCHFAEIKNKIKKWRFIGPEGLMLSRSQYGWLATIEAVLQLWYSFKGKVKHFSTESLNQDPVENLFSVVRQNCGCNYRPNASQFVSGLKTAILTKLVKGRPQGNCKPDYYSLLSSLKNLLDKDAASSSTDLLKNSAEGHIITGQETLPQKKVKLPLKHMKSVAIVADYIATLLLKGNTCEECCSSLVSGKTFPCDAFLEMRSGRACPSEKLARFVGHCITPLDELLAVIGHESNILAKLKEKLRKKVKVSFAKCSKHKIRLENDVITIICMVSIERHCKEKNLSLAKKPQIGFNIFK